jgi:hypothetical protein
MGQAFHPGRVGNDTMDPDGSAFAGERRPTCCTGQGIRFWKLTTATVSGFQLSPAGKDSWGPNQTLND